MANPIQVPSDLSNLKTFPDLARFLSAFCAKVATEINSLVSQKTIWGVVGASAGISFGSGNFSATLASFGLFHIQFRQAYNTVPSVQAHPIGGDYAQVSA
jgi:hypothetical protein